MSAPDDTASATPGAVDWAVHWSDLVSVALLGTDRRDPPEPPAGPLGELALEHPPSDAAGSLIQQVAAVTVARRAAFRPRPVRALLAPPADDQRPACSPLAADLLRRVLAEWPALEPEWLALAATGGWRLSGDLVAVLLARHRSHPERFAEVCDLAGPVAGWLIEHVPTLAPATKRTGTSDVPVVLPAELASIVDDGADRVVAVVADGLRRQRYTQPTRAVLVHLIARVRPGELAEIRARFENLDPQMTGIGLAYHLADLAATRDAIHRALAPGAPVPAEREI